MFDNVDSRLNIDLEDYNVFAHRESVVKVQN